MGKIELAMEYKYNFSIIIPHKNIPELLRRCVSSIPKRDDTEIIIVDDNSDPDKVDFEHFPFKDETNVTIVFDKSSKGAGHARNIGLEKAEGKWYIFADSDDFFFYSINKAMEDCLKSEADIIYYKSTNLDSDTYLLGNRRSGITNNSIDAFLNAEVDGEHLIRMRHPAPWGKIIRAELVHKHNIRFEEILRANDYKFSYLCGYYAKKVEAQDISLYCITSRTNNLTSVVIPGLELIVTKSEADYLLFMREHALQDSVVYKEFQNDVFSKLYEMKKTDYEDYREARNYIRDCGYTNEEIDSRINYISSGRKKAKMVSSIRKILHI